MVKCWQQVGMSIVDQFLRIPGYFILLLGKHIHVRVPSLQNGPFDRLSFLASVVFLLSRNNKFCLTAEFVQLK